MTKYTVVHYFIDERGELNSQQVSRWFDSIQEAEAARSIILSNSEFLHTAQKLRVVQYDFS